MGRPELSRTRIAARPRRRLAASARGPLAGARRRGPRAVRQSSAAERLVARRNGSHGAPVCGGAPVSTTAIAWTFSIDRIPSRDHAAGRVNAPRQPRGVPPREDRPEQDVCEERLERARVLWSRAPRVEEQDVAIERTERSE